MFLSEVGRDATGQPKGFTDQAIDRAVPVMSDEKPPPPADPLKVSSPVKLYILTAEKPRPNHPAKAGPHFSLLGFVVAGDG